MGGHVIMDELNTTAGRLKAYPYLAGIIVPLLVFGVIAVIALASFGMSALMTWHVS
jgi:maltodextrin utilization protein YvdJ